MKNFGGYDDEESDGEPSGVVGGQGKSAASLNRGANMVGIGLMIIALAILADAVFSLWGA